LVFAGAVGGSSWFRPVPLHLFTRQAGESKDRRPSSPSTPARLERRSKPFRDQKGAGARYRPLLERARRGGGME